jgi:hypothetical protein
MMAAGLGVYLSKGVERRMPDPCRATTRSLALARSNDPKAVTQEEVDRGVLPVLGVKDPSIPIRFVLWGDSHAIRAARLFDRMLLDRGMAGRFAGYHGIIPAVGFVPKFRSSLGEKSVSWNDGILEFIRKHQVPDVILVARWSAYARYPHAGGEEEVRRCFSDTVAKLRKAGVRVWVMRQVPEQRNGFAKLLVRHLLHGGTPESFGVSETVYRQQLECERRCLGHEDLEGITFLDSGKYFLKGGLVRATEGYEPLYGDENHLSLAGVELLRPLFEEVLSAGP